jgi:hypothetical protein
VVGVDVVGRVVGWSSVVDVGAVVRGQPHPAEGAVVSGAANASSAGPHAVLAFVRAFVTAVFWAVVSALS